MSNYLWLPLMLFGIVVLIMGMSVSVSSTILDVDSEIPNWFATMFTLIGAVCAIIGTVKMTDWVGKETPQV